MIDYLIFPTKDEAAIRSKDAWETVLGHKKNSQDVTEFLWAVDVGKDGQAALIIDEKPELLKPAEVTAKITDLPDGKGENWEKPSGALPTGPS